MAVKGKVVVKVEEFKGNLRLRWTHESKRYCLSPGLADNETNRAIACLKAADIKQDIKHGMFDATLAKYRTDRPGKLPAKVWEVFDQYTDTKHGQIYPQSLFKYSGALANLRSYFKERSAGTLTTTDCNKFKDWLSARLSPVTLKQQLSLINSAWKWAVERKTVIDNPWQDVARRVPRGAVAAPQPFSATEIQAIVRGFRTHPHYAYYSDYVEFLLGTGARIGEVISLTWGDVLDDCSQVWFGKAHYRGTEKELKAGKAGYVPLSKSLQDLLLKRRPPNTDRNALIFPSPRSGSYLDDANFRNRAWKTVLAELKIPYRKPRTTRSTLISYWLSQGEDPLIVSRYTRTSVKMIYEHYAGYIPSKAQLPNILGDVFATPATGASTGERLLEEGDCV